MKKRTLTFYVSLMASFLIGAQAFAQVTVNMPFNNGPLSFTATAGACPAFNFFDNGGQFGVYGNNSGANSVVTFNPATAGNKIRTTFTAFSTEASWDALYVYDGINIAAPKIASANGLPIGGSPFGTGGWWGTQAPNNVAGATGTVQATATNASGALTYGFRSDASVTLAGWAATIIEVPSASCVMTPSANVTVSTDADGCIADVTVATPAFSPGGCQNTLTLQYRVNGGAAVVIPSPIGATITLLDLPKGINTITWELINVVCGVSIVQASATQSVTVNDLTPPVLTCPPNVTLNLAPGECSTFYSYNVSVTDNCPFITPAAPVQLPASFVNHGSGLAFTLAGNNAPGGLYFNLTNNGGVQAIITGFGVRFPNPAFGAVTVPKTLEIWSTPTTYAGKETNQGLWTNVGPATITANPPYFATGTGAIAQANFLQNVTLNPGETRGFYIFGPNWCPVFNYTFGIQPPITNGPFTQTAGSVSFNFFANLFATGAFAHPNIQVNYLTGGGGDIQQTSGIASGEEFPIGTTTNCFFVEDAAGNDATCCFTVTVNEFPNAIKTLICNDLVNISLDSSCTHTIGADQVLEGGPYRCYDNYIVQLDRIAPFGNGPWTPATLGPGDVGKSYAYRVVDPATNNTCWGMVLVEDKLPPVLVCRDITIPCDSIPEVNPAPAVIGYQIQSTGEINDPIGAPSGPTSRVYDFDYSYIPPGTPVEDVNVCVRLTGHTWLPDLDILVIAPDGSQADCFAVTGCFGQEFPIDCKWDDEGLGGVTACAQLDQNGGPLQCFVAPGNQSNTVLSALDGKDASGVWRIRINDAVAPDDGVIEFLCLELLVNVPGIAVTDGCGPVNLTFQDTEVNTDCASGFTKTIRRKFTATDQSGNSVTCIQNINFARPNLADVVVPPNYDDLQAPAFECTGVYPTPDYLESVGLQGFPYVNGFPVSCGLSITYDDKVIDVCDGTYKIRREWLILDWCTGGEIEYVQLLKVKDDEPPVFDCPANLTVTTDPFNCCATVNLPDVIVSDVCSRINKVSAMIIGISPVAPFDTIGMFTVGGSLTSFPG
ncbi:MAG: HYR domain-containing protein, partial [Saprospiraceae bacterium]|nr:HYR domain-containing protein [Saprospiraceae bacterium]